jgi:hypothetical protein
VVNVSQIVTLDKSVLDDYVGHLTARTVIQVKKEYALFLTGSSGRPLAAKWVAVKTITSRALTTTVCRVDRA